MKNKPDYWYKQSAVVPFIKKDERVEVLIITSTKKRKWILPKGIVELNLTARESAMKEALEEAGVKGKLLSEKLGTYKYKKWGGNCKVKVYALNVYSILDKWEEQYRDRKWVNIDEIHNYIKNDNIIKLTNKLKNILTNNA